MGSSPGQGQTKDYTIGSYFYSIKHAALRRNSRLVDSAHFYNYWSILGKFNFMAPDR